jgi:hypothetical protein
MGRNVARQLIEAHFVSGDLVEGLEVALRVDQTLTQDATGTLVMLELEVLGLDRRAPRSACSTSTTTCSRRRAQRRGPPVSPLGRPPLRPVVFQTG